MLRSPPGQLLAAGQQLVQILSTNGGFRNLVCALARPARACRRCVALRCQPKPALLLRRSSSARLVSSPARQARTASGRHSTVGATRCLLTCLQWFPTSIALMPATPCGAICTICAGWQIALEDGGREVERTFEVLYLDERLRVARFQPEDGREPQLFVFRRAGDPEEAMDDEEEEEEEEDEDEVCISRYAGAWRLCLQGCMQGFSHSKY